MNPFRHLLVATDFGPSSERAVDLAVRLASPFGAKVTIAHVLDAAYWQGVHVLVTSTPGLEDERNAVAQRLKDKAAFCAANGTVCTPLLLEGSPSEKLVAAAFELDVDVIVIGSHGRRGLPRAVLGSVAERVVRLSPVPVLTVHGFWFENRAEAGAELAKKVDSLRGESPVMLAISPGGVLVAAELADAFGSRLDIMLVREVRESNSTTSSAICEDGTVGLGPDGAEEALDEERRAARTEMRDLLAAEGYELRHRGIRSLWHRHVVIVCDELMDARCALLAVDVVERMGARDIRIATPIATAAAVAALKERVSSVTVSHMVDLPMSSTAIYRSGSRTSAGDVQERLAKRAA